MNLVKRVVWLIILVCLVITAGIIYTRRENNYMPEKTDNHNSDQKVSKTIQLPEPNSSSETSFETAVANRRSQRNFKNKPLSLEQVSQILWSAQGITDKTQNFRAAPSAGALYPLELYLVVKDQGINDLDSGLFHYLPETHSLETVLTRDITNNLANTCLDQTFIGDAPVSLVITAEYARVTNKYGDRGRRYVHMEAGHAAQNVYLQTESLGLGTVTVGAFNDNEIIDLLEIPANHEPLYVMPIGYPN